jgi:hypothetical protein
MPFSEVSHSSTKVLLKLGRSRTRVVHIATFKSWKEWYVIGVQLKAIFLKSIVRGDAIFP